MQNKKQDDKNTALRPVSGKLLALGLASVTAGLLLFIFAVAKVKPAHSFAAPTVVIIVCAVVLYQAFIRHLKSWSVFLGLYGFLVSLLFLLVGAEILLLSIADFWPILVLFCGICLIASGFYGKKRLTISYMVPAALLIILGVFFLLFSTDIIHVKLSSFAAKWFPIGLILIGIVLVVLFFFRSAIRRETELLKLHDDDFDDLRGGD